MKKILSRQDGVALVMSLILLVVVGILAAAFLRSSLHNIVFGQSELDEQRAFYAAEAGIEHLISENNFDEDTANDLDEQIITYGNGEDARYEVEFLGDDDGVMKFESTGHFNGASETIKIGLGGLSWGGEHGININNPDEEWWDDSLYQLPGEEGADEEDKLERNILVGPIFEHTDDINNYDDLESVFNDQDEVYIDLLNKSSGEEENDEENDEENGADDDDAEEIEEEDYEDIEVKDKYEGKVVFVDGNLEPPITSNLTFKDSIVIVREGVQFTGDMTFENSQLIVFNENSGNNHPGASTASNTSGGGQAPVRIVGVPSGDFSFDPGKLYGTISENVVESYPEPPEDRDLPDGSEVVFEILEEMENMSESVWYGVR